MKYLAPPKSPFLRWLIRISHSFLKQIGYQATTDNFVFAYRNGTFVVLFAESISFFLGLRTLDDTELIGNICTAFGVFIPVFWNHKHAIRNYRKRQNRNNSIPVTNRPAFRSPHGTELVIYGLVAFYSLLAFGYRCFFGEIAVWIINFSVLFIEFISMLISLLVLLFDAELIID